MTKLIFTKIHHEKSNNKNRTLQTCNYYDTILAFYDYPL